MYYYVTVDLRKTQFQDSLPCKEITFAFRTVIFFSESVHTVHTAEQ